MHSLVHPEHRDQVSAQLARPVPCLLLAVFEDDVSHAPSKLLLNLGPHPAQHAGEGGAAVVAPSTHLNEGHHICSKLGIFLKGEEVVVFRTC